MENDFKNSYRSGYRKGVILGIALMIIGLMFLGVNFNFISRVWTSIVISWPMLLIFIGVIHLFRKRLVSATVLILVGGFFLAPKIMPQLSANFVNIYWPILLIGGGLILLLHHFICPSHGANACRNDWHHHRHRRFRSQEGSEYYSNANTNCFSKNSVFGGGDHIFLDPEFKGGEMNAVFGGISLDLRRTNLPEGDTYLEVNAVFGGVTIFVPSNWQVETHLDSVFGGFQDNRAPAAQLDTSRRLIISGACVFGGGELRN